MTSGAVVAGVERRADPQYAGHSNAVLCLQVVGDTLFTGFGDKTARSWSVSSGAPIRTYAGHSGAVCLQVVGDTLFTGSGTRRRGRGRRRAALHPHVRGPQRWVLCLQVVGDTLFTGSGDKTARSWSVSKGLVLDGLGESLTQPPPEVVARGVDAALDFLRDLHEGGTPLPRRAALVMLVGDGGAGKTSLWRSLNAQRPLADDVRRATDGIAMCEATWAAAGASGAEDVAITAWDFAGQDDYFLTHAYFLQRRCEHVIVSRARATEAERGGAGVFAALARAASVLGATAAADACHHTRIDHARRNTACRA